MKTCTKCEAEKTTEEFRARVGPKVSKDGLSPVCRICERDAKRAYDAKKKQENSLKTCTICNATKHYTLFMKSAKRGDKCLDCIKIKEQRELEDKERREFENSVQHQDGKKRCSKCRLFKLEEEFWKSKDTNDGFYSSCIECTKAIRINGRDERLIKQKEWKEKNRNRVREYYNIWDKNKRATDVVYKLKRNTMHAIIASIRNYGFKNEQSEKLTKAIFDHLPYSAEQLKQHIESLWEPWMNWDNYGKFDATQETWQIDHIIPQSSLPFSDFNEDNFKKLWVLDNLRPLSTIENIKKSNTQ